MINPLVVGTLRAPTRAEFVKCVQRHCPRSPKLLNVKCTITYMFRIFSTYGVGVDEHVLMPNHAFVNMVGVPGVACVCLCERSRLRCAYPMSHFL